MTQQPNESSIEAAAAAAIATAGLGFPCFTTNIRAADHGSASNGFDRLVGRLLERLSPAEGQTDPADHAQDR